MIALAQPNPGRARSRNSIGSSAVPFSIPPHALHVHIAAPLFAGPATGMRAAFDLIAARPYRRTASRAIEIEGGPRHLMSYDARAFNSSPQEKARRRLEAGETGERENIDRSKLSILAFMYQMRNQASGIVPYAVKSGSRPETFSSVLKS